MSRSEVTLCSFVNKHHNVVLEIREGDKVLAWCAFTGPQAEGLAETIHDLAQMAIRADQQNEQDANARAH